MTKSIAAVVRLLAKVRYAPNGCWEFTGSLTRDGYGQMYYRDGVKAGAHRISYMEFVGPIPEGWQIDHLCRVRNCVNPDHLEAVTIRENVLRSENPAAKCAVKTKCVKGHPFDDENTIINKNGHRLCRRCRRATTDRTLARKREAHRLAGTGRVFSTPRVY